MKTISTVVALLCLLPRLSCAGEHAAAAPLYRLRVSFDIPLAKIIGIAEMPVLAGRELSLKTGGLAISMVEVNGRAATFSTREGITSIQPPADGLLEIRYTGEFKGGGGFGSNSAGVSSVISSRGLSLTGLWYPQPSGLMVYHLEASLPRGYEAISEAEKITRIDKPSGRDYKFEFSHPLDGLSFVASDRYQVLEGKAGAVKLAAYFFREDRELAHSYLRAAQRYLGLYEKLLTKYPYYRFSIVENFLPTGYSMPTFTLLGRDVVRLPFIIDTSLGHEILHQWFGNSVFSDYEKGNWAEGLTTYLADHFYEEQKGRGWQYRKQQLIDYGAYVNGANEFALGEFRSRTDDRARAIGYGKAAMVFHMLRKKVGDEKFFAALKEFIDQRQFQRASWEDLKQVFEKATGRGLASFFEQWIDEKGLPEISVNNARVRRKGAKYEISCEISQSPASPVLDLSVSILSWKGLIRKEMVTLESEKKEIVFEVDEEPARLLVDEDYDVARKLTAGETPPVIAQLLGGEKVIIAVPEQGVDRFAALRESFLARGAIERDAAKLDYGEIKSSSLIILGSHNPLLRRLFAGFKAPPAGFSISVQKHPWNEKKVVAIIDAEGAEEVRAALPKIFHYGGYSSLSFAKGKNISKDTQSSARGIGVDIRGEPAALISSQITTLTDVIAAASAKKIVYVGEHHDNFSHHDVQLLIIKALHEKKRKVALGMEMFQRPFQGVLDDYLSGAIDERQFLEKTEYFQRWVFDYNLYKPILDYARAKKIPVIALNMRREITEKVSREGIDSLTETERQELPQEMDFSAGEYRDRLHLVFKEHKNAKDGNFDFFLQAQVLWDETMAESITAYLKKNPDRQMVVIAGNGHVAYKDGIPKRAYRRNGLSYTVILNDGELEPDSADYLIFPQPLDGLKAPLLMVDIRDEKGKVSIAGFTEESVAKKAGLQEGDVIVAVDGKHVRGLQDLKLALFFKQKGEIIKVSVIRSDVTIGTYEKEFEVKL